MKISPYSGSVVLLERRPCSAYKLLNLFRIAYCSRSMTRRPTRSTGTKYVYLTSDLTSALPALDIGYSRGRHKPRLIAIIPNNSSSTFPLQVEEARPTLNTRPPNIYPHLELKLKQFDVRLLLRYPHPRVHQSASLLSFRSNINVERR